MFRVKNKSKTVLTRNSTFDPAVGKPHSESLANECQLPLNSLVLQRYHHLRLVNSTDGKPTGSTRKVFTGIYSELKVVWDRANVPIKSDKDVLDQLVKLFKHWDSIRKLGSRVTNPSEATKRRLESFHLKMNELCDISAVDCYWKLRVSRQPKWKEDWLFLLDQREARLRYLDRVDPVTAAFEKRRERRNGRSSRSMDEEEIREELEDIERETDEHNSGTEDTYVLPIPKRRRSSRVTLQVPRRNITIATTPVSDRLGFSITDQVAFQSSVINIGMVSINL